MLPGYKRVIVIWLVSSTGGITVALHLIPQINIRLMINSYYGNEHDSEEIYKE
jgi:hypothetical protein